MEDIPDGVPMGMEIEYFADTHELPLVPWQRRMLLRMFPNPVGEEQPKVNLRLYFRRR